MGTRLLQIPAPLNNLATISRDDLDWFVLGGIHIPAGSSNGVGRIYRINADLSIITISNGFGTAGKDNTIVFKILPNGTLRATLSEAAVNPDGTSASGATDTPTVYDFPGVFPAYAGSGTIDAWARQQITALDLRLDRIASGAAG